MPLLGVTSSRVITKQRLLRQVEEEEDLYPAPGGNEYCEVVLSSLEGT